MPERPLRFCDVCGGLDDHPRHVHGDPGNGTVPTQEFLAALPAGPPGVPMSAIASAIALLMDPNTTIRHMDCCAAAGCPACAVTEAATGGVRGQALIDAIAGGILNDVEV